LNNDCYLFDKTTRALHTRTRPPACSLSHSPVDGNRWIMMLRTSSLFLTVVIQTNTATSDVCNPYCYIMRTHMAYKVFFSRISAVRQCGKYSLNICIMYTIVRVYRGAGCRPLHTKHASRVYSCTFRYNHIATIVHWVTFLCIYSPGQRPVDQNASVQPRG